MITKMMIINYYNDDNGGDDLNLTILLFSA